MVGGWKEDDRKTEISLHRCVQPVHLDGSDLWDFPSSPGVKTPSSQHRVPNAGGTAWMPGWGNWDFRFCTVQPKGGDGVYRLTKQSQTLDLGPSTATVLPTGGTSVLLVMWDLAP